MNIKYLKVGSKVILNNDGDVHTIIVIKINLAYPSKVISIITDKFEKEYGDGDINWEETRKLYNLEQGWKPPHLREDDKVGGTYSEYVLKEEERPSDKIRILLEDGFEITDDKFEYCVAFYEYEADFWCLSIFTRENQKENSFINIEWSTNPFCDSFHMFEDIKPLLDKLGIEIVKPKEYKIKTKKVSEKLYEKLAELGIELEEITYE